MRFLIVIMSIVSVISFNPHYIHNQNDLVKYITKGSFTYVKNYVSFSDLKDQVSLSYHENKDKITFPLEKTDPILKTLFTDALKFGHLEKRYRVKNIHFHSHLSSEGTRGTESIFDVSFFVKII